VTTPIKIGFSREELHEESSHVPLEARQEADEWLKTRPTIIQETAKGLDQFAVYRVKEGAPHLITGPGTIGAIIGFTESGQVIFAAHVLVPHPNCETWKVEKTKELDGAIKVHLDGASLELDPKP
jgi:hypothetical protein